MNHPPPVSRFWLKVFIDVPLGLGLFVAGLLREDPAFWTQAGGYPVLVREAVLVLFWPLWLGGVISALAGWYWCWWHLKPDTVGRGLILTFSSFQTSLLVGILIIAILN